jgi:hypothetical protein
MVRTWRQESGLREVLFALSSAVAVSAARAWSLEKSNFLSQDNATQGLLEEVPKLSSMYETKTINEHHSS